MQNWTEELLDQNHKDLQETLVKGEIGWVASHKHWPDQRSTITLKDFTSLENPFIIFSGFTFTTALQHLADRETLGLLGN